MPFCLAHVLFTVLSIKYRRLPLPSVRQHPSYGDCLEIKREYYQNSSVLDRVTQCSQSAAHLHEQFLQVQQVGFVTLGPLYAVRRGGCLELYYCNMVEWFWWDSSLISTTNWFLSVLWHCWFGHPACKNRPPNYLYNVLSGTLSLYTLLLLLILTVIHSEAR